MKKPFKYFVTSCVDSDADSIINMVDAAKDITYNTFLKHVGFEQIKEFNQPWLPLRKDYHVRYYKSKYRGENCVFFVHSAIEYVFV